ncbi:MAG: hypothetical protein WBD25_00630 [Terriglobales bacterium]|jgi:hypothetical protein
MLIRQEIGIWKTMLITRFHKVFSLPVQLCALIVFGVIASDPAAQVFAQETPKLETQASPSPAAIPPPGQAPPSRPAPIPPVALYNLLQRKSIVFPDIAYSTERLSVGQKFELSVDNSISVNSITWSMLGSAVGQADDSPTGYEQGWDGYAKRFGSDMGREASGEFFGTFIIASALHEDPRFYAEINPSFFHAAKYSVQHVFIMSNDDGHEVVAWSRLAGPLMAEGLANVYYPDRNRTVGDTFFRYGLDLASRAGGNMLREYWPVFIKKISHNRPSTSGHN